MKIYGIEYIRFKDFDNKWYRWIFVIWTFKKADKKIRDFYKGIIYVFIFGIKLKIKL